MVDNKRIESVRDTNKKIEKKSKSQTTNEQREQFLNELQNKLSETQKETKQKSSLNTQNPFAEQGAGAQAISHSPASELMKLPENTSKFGFDHRVNPTTNDLI